MANLHLTAGSRSHAEREAVRAAQTAVDWAGAATPLIVGGDFNLQACRQPTCSKRSSATTTCARPPRRRRSIICWHGASKSIRPPVAWPVERRELEVHVGLEMRRLRLSDHAPVEATYALR